MTTLDQLKGCLALADSALACNKDTLTINIHKHTVNGNAGSQLNAKPTDDLRHKAGCGSLCNEGRYIVLIGKIDHILGRSCHGAEDYAGNLAGDKTLVLKCPLLIT